MHQGCFLVVGDGLLRVLGLYALMTCNMRMIFDFIIDFHALCRLCFLPVIRTSRLMYVGLCVTLLEWLGIKRWPGKSRGSKRT